MNTKLNHIQDWPELARQANWSASKLAKKCGVSVSTLRRYFVVIIGESPGLWLTKERQRRAIAMLRDGASVKETASSLGYAQQTNFTRKFKEHWGVCPTAEPPVLPINAVLMQND